MSQVSSLVRRLLKREKTPSPMSLKAPVGVRRQVIIRQDGHVASLDHDYYGKLRVFSEDSAISAHMLDGVSVWESDIVAVFAREFPSGRNVIDAGANLGLHSIALAKLAKRGEKIFAFEPHPEIFPLTRHNCGQYSNIECINKAASDAEQVLYMPSILTAYNAGGAVVQSDRGDCAHAVQSVTIDSLELPNIGLMKIDVEGHEMSCIHGAVKTIRRNRPTLIVEICGGNTLETASPEVADTIRARIREICGLGYSMTQVSPHDYLFHPAA
jgi:FkbM family methyltransferase